MKQCDLISKRWDAEYASGKYANEKPVKFVQNIISTLKKSRDSILGLRGLYVGCGNGRNYVPLASSGLNLLGIDVSAVAIQDLSQKNPSLSENLFCKDFEDFESDVLFDYVIAIQIFQHGTVSEISKYFDKASSLLKPGGLLFLRVNSNSTEIYFKHTVIETNVHGGFTINYDEGPKKGLNIHFFAQKELEKYLLYRNFKLVSEPIEDSTLRIPPKTGTWSQWEIISEKNK